MKFQAKQFCSGYVYFSFEAKDEAEAKQFIAELNEGNGVDAVMKQEGFDIDDGSEMRLVK